MTQTENKDRRSAEELRELIQKLFPQDETPETSPRVVPRKTTVRREYVDTFVTYGAYEEPI